MIQTVTLNKRTFEFELNDEADLSVFNEIFVEKEYRGLDEILKKAKHAVIDVGAHKGFFTSYVRALNEGVAIFAFEPEEKNFSLLKKNLLKNHIKNAVLKNLAISAVSGKRQLSLSADSHNHSLLEDFGEALGQKEVQSTTLEEVFRKNRLSFAYLVKLDCEGAEFEILSGLPAEIFAKVGAFYIEYHIFNEKMRPEILKVLLEKNGFKVEMRPSSYDKRFGFILAKNRL
ncbi:FkbM family methyltransferase [Candidatus Peregrinibacteria bacterium]|nr:FkbM family methyltransferase [Candidatus Peregrinibacteria bacterium]